MPWFRISFDFEYEETEDLDGLTDSVVEQALSVIDPTCLVKDELSEQGREWYAVGREVTKEYEEDFLQGEISPN